MNWNFWKTLAFDTELESFLIESRLYPYLQEALRILQKYESGEEFLLVDCKETYDTGDIKVDVSRTFSGLLCVHVFDRHYNSWIEMYSSFHFFEHDFDLRTKLFSDTGESESVFIKQTQIYASLKSCCKHIHKKHKNKQYVQHSKQVLKKDSQTDRL